MRRDVEAAPDKYLGLVHADGRMDYHVAGQADEDTGRISGQSTLAQARVAFLVLV